jgi:hypothetical protein
MKKIWTLLLLITALVSTSCAKSQDPSGPSKPDVPTDTGKPDNPGRPSGDGNDSGNTGSTEFNDYNGYYSSISSSMTGGTNGTLRTALTKLITPKAYYTYSGSGVGELGYELQYYDEDPNNSKNMILFYTI